MKVFLRLQKGVLTKAIDVPESCVATDYRLPFHRPMTAHLIGEIQDLTTATPQNKCLVFRWDRTSRWGGNDAPILDLVDVQ